MGYKNEVIHHQGSWRGISNVEYATLEWIDWFNRRRLVGLGLHASDGI